MGINVIDMIVVLHVTEKGTSSSILPIKPVDFMGEENKKQNLDRLKLAKDMWVASAKGTSRIHLSKMREAKPVNVKGRYISTGKGTGRIKI